MGIDPEILGVLRRLGPRLLAEVGWSLLLGRRRSLAEDAKRVVARMGLPPRVEGMRQIPQSDPFVLVGNHFQAPGLWVGWTAAAITSAVAEAREPGRRELHWVALSEWRWFEIGGIWVPNLISSLLFPRASQVWGLIPMPPRPTDVAGRARALRQVLTYLGRRPGAEGAAPEPVGVFPEGRASTALEEAMPGTGAFLHRISGLGVPLLPVGVHRENGALALRFGQPFFLAGLPPGGREELDGWARQQVMVAIGRLLPRGMWGVYATAISQAS